MIIECEKSYHRAVRVIVRALAYDPLQQSERHFREAAGQMLDPLGAPLFSEKAVKSGAKSLIEALQSGEPLGSERAAEALDHILSDGWRSLLAASKETLIRALDESSFPSAAAAAS